MSASRRRENSKVVAEGAKGQSRQSNDDLEIDDYIHNQGDGKNRSLLDQQNGVEIGGEANELTPPTKNVGSQDEGNSHRLVSDKQSVGKAWAKLLLKGGYDVALVPRDINLPRLPVSAVNFDQALQILKKAKRRSRIIALAWRHVRQLGRRQR